MNPDKRIETNCLLCGKLYKYNIKQQTGKFCSNKCFQQNRTKLLIDSWLNGLTNPIKAGGRLCSWARTYLINQSNKKCSLCGWNKINPKTNKCPLEIDHIDGNSENCNISNLRVLCPNCHSLTETYKALNKGKGSTKRLNYSKLKP